MRRAGVLLPVSALPSPYGIGDLGESAYRFVDFLAEAGQTLWQVLPIHPTAAGDSPYQSPSAFAGNPYFISPSLLCRQGLLTRQELPKESRGEIDYGALFLSRHALLWQAFERFDPEDAHFAAFCTSQASWLEDYALFTALKEQYGHIPFAAFPVRLRDRDAESLDACRDELRERILYHKFLQFVFFTQWLDVKDYANRRGISIIGDIPLYVAADSADVWAHPTLFRLRDDKTPSVVAGVPPDAFSASGQRWGNPIYDYDAMEKDGFAWWKARIAACARLYDALRIDHFIGIVRCYEIDAALPTAEFGVRKPGPGKALLDAIEAARGETAIIAEDLGESGADVTALLDAYGYPGMKVLLFAADGHPDNPFLPYRWEKQAVVYVGTHDNDTAMGFVKSHTKEELAFLLDYTNTVHRRDLPDGLIRCALGSVCDTAVIAMQDWLDLDGRARMNTPSTVGGNWRWRLESDDLTNDLAARMRRLTAVYGRERSRI